MSVNVFQYSIELHMKAVPNAVDAACCAGCVYAINYYRFNLKTFDPNHLPYLFFYASCMQPKLYNQIICAECFPTAHTSHFFHKVCL